MGCSYWWGCCAAEVGRARSPWTGVNSSPPARGRGRGREEEPLRVTTSAETVRPVQSFPSCYRLASRTVPGKCYDAELFKQRHELRQSDLLSARDSVPGSSIWFPAAAYYFYILFFLFFLYYGWRKDSLGQSRCMQVLLVLAHSNPLLYAERTHRLKRFFMRLDSGT